MSFLTHYESNAEGGRNGIAVNVAGDIITLEKQVVASHNRIDELNDENDKMKIVIGKLEHDIIELTKRMDKASQYVASMKKEKVA